VGYPHPTFTLDTRFGGWSILAMLISLLIQVGTGLFANDDILTEGPFYALVSKQTSAKIAARFKYR